MLLLSCKKLQPKFKHKAGFAVANFYPIKEA